MRNERAGRTGLLRSAGVLPLVVGLLLIGAVSLHRVDSAPRFKSFKLRSLDNTAVTLEDFRSQATLVSFFFPSCTHCNAALPEMARIYEKYRDQGLKMVWINVLEKEEKRIAGWLAEHGYSVLVLVGASLRSLQRDYELKMTPEHYLLNADAEILFKQVGYQAGDEKAMEENVRKALQLDSN